MLRSTPLRRVRGAAAPVCLLLAISAASILWSCAAPAPASSETLTLRIGARGTDEAPGIIRSMLFAEGLMAIDGQGRPAARLAESWGWDDPGLTLQVRLRPGVRFHDDTPVTTEVVAAILRPNIGKSPGFEAVKTIEARDPQTILFHLSRPDGFLPSVLGNTSIVDPKKPNIGTGPFKLIPDSSPLEAVRNSSYYRDNRASNGSRSLRATPRASWAGLMRGEVNMALEINKELGEFLEARPSSKSTPRFSPTTFHWFSISAIRSWRGPKCAARFPRLSIARKSSRRECAARDRSPTPTIRSGRLTGLTTLVRPRARLRTARTPRACDWMRRAFRSGLGWQDSVPVASS